MEMKGNDMTSNQMKLAAAARDERSIARRYNAAKLELHRARTDAAKLELHRARMDWLYSRAETNELRETVLDEKGMG